MKFSALKQVLFVRGHPSAFREGEVFATFSGFEGEVPISLYSLYIFTSSSAQDKEKSASLGRFFLPNCLLG